ncbi:Hypothetical protein ERS027661_04923 [Mycobacterium tuberculosis]|uniref:Uncharacterized protein n=1 Tax=Mycobacterium tuberculosis TaxID=1773 RepID=A0A655AQK5_MYCTX|nr:Hypothetical protein ERS027661_04923 [Mycobacterium tuberculosis]
MEGTILRENGSYAALVAADEELWTGPPVELADATHRL